MPDQDYQSINNLMLGVLVLIVSGFGLVVFIGVVWRERKNKKNWDKD
jgi:hypothetical protein